MGCVGQDSRRRRKALWKTLDAEHHAQCRCRGPRPEYFQPPGRQTLHVQHPQIVNVLQSLLLTDGPEGKSCIRTSTYHAFALFQPHRSKTAVRVETQDSSPLAVSVSASKAQNELVVSFVNPRHDADFEIDCTLQASTAREAKAVVLHDPDWNACNTFENPNRLLPQPHTVTLDGSRLRMDLPRLSVATVTVRTG